MMMIEWHTLVMMVAYVCMGRRRKRKRRRVAR